MSICVLRMMFLGECATEVRASAGVLLYIGPIHV